MWLNFEFFWVLHVAVNSLRQVIGLWLIRLLFVNLQIGSPNLVSWLLTWWYHFSGWVLLPTRSAWRWNVSLLKNILLCDYTLKCLVEYCLQYWVLIFFVVTCGHWNSTFSCKKSWVYLKLGNSIFDIMILLGIISLSFK